jgi:serine/threonine-protein phosphatase 4 catalytic subunit
MTMSLDRREYLLAHPDQIPFLTESDITSLLDQVMPFFEKEPALMELGGHLAFVGDLHGDFSTACAIVQRFSQVDHLVFLGDYIDRAPIPGGSLFTIVYLLLLKLHYPERIILLKGNHESIFTIPCFPYQFDTDIKNRFGSLALHDVFLRVFSAFPLMVLSHHIYAAHGGFLVHASKADLVRLNKTNGDVFADIVWSDPGVSPTYRGIGHRFTEDELTVFLHRLSASVFLRGHDYNTLGVSLFHDRCLTLFSSQAYQNRGNGGIVVAQTKNDVSVASDLLVENYATGEWRPYTIAKR